MYAIRSYYGYIDSSNAILGTFIVARVNNEGQYISLTAKDIKKYTAKFEVTENKASKQIDQLQMKFDFVNQEIEKAQYDFFNNVNGSAERYNNLQKQADDLEIQINNIVDVQDNIKSLQLKIDYRHNPSNQIVGRITSYNVCYTKLLRNQF